RSVRRLRVFLYNHSATAVFCSRSLHDALPICAAPILALFFFALGFLMPVQAFAETVEQRIARLEPHYTIRRPENASGPAPVVIKIGRASCREREQKKEFAKCSKLEWKES